MINLIIGTWAAVYANQMYKSYVSSFLQPIVLYTIMYNLGIFIFLIHLYLKTNLPENFLAEYLPISKDIDLLFVSLFQIGLVYSMLRIYLMFQGRDISSRGKNWVGAVVIVYVLSYGLKVLLSPQAAAYKYLHSFQDIIYENFIVFEIPILIIMLIHGMRIRDKGLKKINNAFASLYLSRYGIVLFLFLMAVIKPININLREQVPRPIWILILMGIFMSFNVIPFIWIKYFFVKYAESMFRFKGDKAVLEPIYEKYNVSKREQEILELLLSGNSNKEIKDRLFISYHTVKNHIYSLYQKLDVKNRYELVHMFMKLQNKDR